MNVHYFSPGPARLPEEVRNQIKEELLDTFGMGVSIMEISHRSKQYEQLSQETLALARKTFQVPDTHSLLFSVCGAQQHFSLLTQHLSAPEDEIAYTNTGVWSHLACEEAYASGRKVHLVYDGRPNYSTLGNPKEWKIPKKAKYVHITVNNTVYGTEYKEIPTFADIPVVLDMTSSLGARTDIPWESTALVYASAQKNFGIAGVSVIIMRNDLLEKSRELTKLDRVGKALTYHAVFDAKSALNTPPVFPIFAMNKMLNWIASCGGVSTMEKWANEKAKMVYSEIDAGFYLFNIDKSYRSRHNFVFKLPSAKQDEHFIQEAQKNGILEIKGYKSLGGIRASMYNGVSLESASIFAEFMREYRKKFG
ncbi:3-phosphoserine/phosphohydroxythreonine transaminase [Fluviispira sanaruensis]|uniref:Phosphoserine aminotransferase n=1 Tax=Fluviispira sanaruensis TaxID=2493639 RepID=A0A4P2VLN7_FLUSA|nr:3-phosphoserine/phosphohydroxythreonine transaminase [Fluviispira sanaruensis]BBH54256.1 3-phosphoserine/phosphohydroxythreonine transaminase [Fluviispira sanaruensis]